MRAKKRKTPKLPITIVIEGHVYRLPELGSDSEQLIVFVRRSGGAINYKDEWPGLQVQTVLRALIDRTKYLDGVLPCAETANALWHLRMALFEYEARAYRRKQEKVNRGRSSHDDSERPRPWRTHLYSDIPFTEDGIELLPVGLDGHIIFSKREKGGRR